MSQFPPTDEQTTILDAVATGADVVVQAGAGAGKTSTMRMIAEQLPGRRGIYTAFNRAIVQAAKNSFPSGVTAQTTFSMAYRAGGYAWKDRLNIFGQTLGDVAKILRINEPLRISPDLAPLAPRQIARLAIGTVDRFCSSADPEITTWHVPDVPGIVEPAARTALRQEILPFALRAWEDMSRSKTGQLRVKPGLYFKRWAMTHPRINADYLLLDESQDTDRVLQAVLREQDHLQRIVIGDDAQRIYVWRGAVSLMGDYPDAAHCQLSQSFRFGQRVADEANKWLDHVGTSLRLTGNPARDSRVGQIDKPDAVLTRTNAGAVGEAMRAHAEGARVHLAGAGDAVKSLALAAQQLQAGRRTDHPELCMFETWGAVQEFVEDGLASSELESTVRLLDTYGTDVVVAAISATVPAQVADRIVTTVHKCKGLEFDAVRIGDDFTEPGEDEDVEEEPAMLAYVAVTRAKTALDRGSLSWIDTRPALGRSSLRKG